MEMSELKRKFERNSNFELHSERNGELKILSKNEVNTMPVAISNLISNGDARVVDFSVLLPSQGLLIWLEPLG